MPVITESERVEYVQPVSGKLEIIPKQGIHINELRRLLQEHQLDAGFVTERLVKISVPEREEDAWIEKVRSLSFVERVQREYYFDPSN